MLKRQVVGLLVGQFVSLSIFLTSITSELLEKNSLRAPLTQNVFFYLLISIFCCCYCILKKRSSILKTIIKEKWIVLIFASLTDVQGNYLVVKSYQKANITNVQLMDSLIIVTVFAITATLTRVRYRPVHFICVAILIGGDSCIVGGDILLNGYSGFKSISGLVFAFFGFVSYGISNVLQEYLVKSIETSDFLAIFGTLGLIITSIQLGILEHNSVREIEFTAQIGYLLLGYTVCMLVIYLLTPFVLKFTNAMILNISVLSSDIFTHIYGYLHLHYRFHFLHIIAFFIITIGAAIYMMYEPKNEPDYKIINKIEEFMNNYRLSSWELKSKIEWAFDKLRSQSKGSPVESEKKSTRKRKRQESRKPTEDIIEERETGEQIV